MLAYTLTRVINSPGWFINVPELDIRTEHDIIVISRQNKLGVHEAPEILYSAASSSQERENNQDHIGATNQTPDLGKLNST